MMRVQTVLRANRVCIQRLAASCDIAVAGLMTLRVVCVAGGGVHEICETSHGISSRRTHAGSTGMRATNPAPSGFGYTWRTRDRIGWLVTRVLAYITAPIAAWTHARLHGVSGCSTWRNGSDVSGTLHPLAAATLISIAYSTPLRVAMRSMRVAHRSFAFRTGASTRVGL